MDALNSDTDRQALLLSIVSSVTFDGWTDHALRSGATAAGATRADVARSFPDGVPEVIDAFADWADRAMEAALAGRDLAALTLHDRLALAVRSRLEALAPYREAVRSGLAYIALPPNLGLGTRLLLRTIDRLWYAVGDTSTDFRWYTKRGSLAAVLTMTVLYWLEDRSEDGAETWAFLDRRLGAVVGSAGRAGGTESLHQIGNLFSLMPSPRRFARQLRRQAQGY